MQQNFIFTEQILPDTPYPAVANQLPRNDTSWNDIMEYSPENWNLQPEELAVELPGSPACLLNTCLLQNCMD